MTDTFGCSAPSLWQTRLGLTIYALWPVWKINRLYGVISVGRCTGIEPFHIGMRGHSPNVRIFQRTSSYGRLHPQHHAKVNYTCCNLKGRVHWNQLASCRTPTSSSPLPLWTPLILPQTISHHLTHARQIINSMMFPIAIRTAASQLFRRNFATTLARNNTAAGGSMSTVMEKPLGAFKGGYV